MHLICMKERTQVSTTSQQQNYGSFTPIHEHSLVKTQSLCSTCSHPSSCSSVLLFASNPLTSQDFYFRFFCFFYCLWFMKKSNINAKHQTIAFFVNCSDLWWLQFIHSHEGVVSQWLNSSPKFFYVAFYSGDNIISRVTGQKSVNLFIRSHCVLNHFKKISQKIISWSQFRPALSEVKPNQFVISWPLVHFQNCPLIKGYNCNVINPGNQTVTCGCYLV